MRLLLFFCVLLQLSTPLSAAENESGQNRSNDVAPDEKSASQQEDEELIADLELLELLELLEDINAVSNMEDKK